MASRVRPAMRSKETAAETGATRPARQERPGAAAGAVGTEAPAGDVVVAPEAAAAGRRVAGWAGAGVGQPAGQGSAGALPAEVSPARRGGGAPSGAPPSRPLGSGMARIRGRLRAAGWLQPGWAFRRRTALGRFSAFRSRRNRREQSRLRIDWHDPARMGRSPAPHRVGCRGSRRRRLLGLRFLDALRRRRLWLHGTPQAPPGPPCGGDGRPAAPRYSKEWL